MNIFREKSNVVPKEKAVSRTLVVAAINSYVSEIHKVSVVLGLNLRYELNK